MLVVHPIEAPLFDALFNHSGDFLTIYDKRDELIRRLKEGERLDRLVVEAKKFASRWTHGT